MLGPRSQSKTLVLAGAIAVLLQACVASPGASTVATPAAGNSTPTGVVSDPCTAAAQSVGGKVAASFNTTIAKLRAMPQLSVQPQLASYADTQAVALCYVDGAIPKGPPPGPDGSIPPSYDRAVFVVVGGHYQFLMAWYREDLPATAP